MKVKKVIKIIQKDGWYKINQVGSHRQYKHPVKKGRVTIAGDENDDLHPKTLASIFDQASLARPGRK